MREPPVSEAEIAAMRRALSAAAAHRPHPNPRVGSVVLDAQGVIVGRGAHERPGTPHAERHALEAAGELARGGTAVVTLEPCVHHGRTGPCTDALIAAGIARVVVGVMDPDPRVAGAGLARLQEAGVEVVAGVLSDEAEALDPAYFLHRRLGRPMVTGLVAVTVDGQAADAGGNPAALLLGPDALDDVLAWRSSADVVLVGSGYAGRVQPPLLHVPEPTPHYAVISGRRQPRIRPELFPAPPTVFAAGDRVGDVSAKPVGTPDGKVDLGRVLGLLADAGHLDVLFEGGLPLLGALAGLGLVDRYVVYVAARLAGGRGRSLFDGEWATMELARSVRVESAVQLGADVRLEIVAEEA